MSLWEKAKYLVARIGYLLKFGSGDAKPSLRFEFPDSEKQALSKLSADERQKELEKTRAELRATLGELLMFFEYAVTYSGYLYNVNAFDQPGVELGKEYTYGLMGRDGHARPAGAEVAWPPGPSPDCR